MAEVQCSGAERYPPPPVLSKNPFPHSTFPVRGVTSGLLASGLNYPVLAHNPPGWEGQPPPSPLQQLIATPEGFLAKQRRRLAEGGAAGGARGGGGDGRGAGADGILRAGGGGAGVAGRGRRRHGRFGAGYGGAGGYGSGAGGGLDDDAEWFDDGGDEEDPAEEAAEEGLGIGMPVRVCNFFAPGSDCYNGLIGDVVNVQTVPESAGQEELLFTVRCLCSVQRRRTFSSVSAIPVSPMAHEAIAANRKVLRPGASDEMGMDDLPPMVILDKLPSEKLEALS